MSTTRTWTANASGSWRDEFGGWRTDNDDVYQGEWSSYGHHKGLWFFNDSDIRSKLADQNVLSIRLKLTRRSAGGSTSAQTPTIRHHNYSSQPGGEPSLSSANVTSQSWAWGETKWVTITTGWGPAIRDGLIRGFAVYTTSSSPYMIFTPTAVLEITYEPSLEPPSTPSGFSVSNVTTSSAHLSWNAVSDADHYRYTNQQLNPTGTTNDFTTENTSITNSSGISSNRRYRWRVRAENAAGNSSYTSYVYRTTLPLTPTGVGATPASGTAGETSILVYWNHIAGTELDRYRVSRSGSGTSTTTSDSLTWGGLSPDTTYSFAVRAENAEGNSAYSGWVSAKTKLPAPATPNQPSASNVAETSMTISWDAVSYAENYDLEHNGTIIRSATTSRSHSVTGLADGVTHEFRVRARNATGTSSYSTILSVDTPPIHVAPPVPTAVGPSGFVDPGTVDLTATTSEMDQEKNYDLEQRVRWEVSKDPNFASDVHLFISPFSATFGTVTAEISLALDLDGVGVYYVRARAEHNGDNDTLSAWSSTEEFTYTRVKVWDGSAWVQRRVKVWDGTAWVERDLHAFVEPEGEGEIVLDPLWG